MNKTQRSIHRAFLLSASLVIVFMSAAASAQPTSAQQSAIRSNCRSDFMSKCSGVTPGGKDALECLQKNVASLSPGCKKAVSDTMPKPEPAKKSEAAPPPPPPPSSPPQQEATPEKTVTAPPASAPAPKAALARPAPKPKAPAAPKPAPVVMAQSKPTSAQQNAIRSSCRNDFMSHCSGVQPGGEAALACLQKNVGRLSAACKRAVSATLPHVAAPVEAAPPPPPPAAQEAPPPAQPGSKFVRGGILIEKACARYIIMHCRGMGLDMSRKVACLVDLVHSGKFVGPRCKGALEISGHLR